MTAPKVLRQARACLAPDCTVRFTPQRSTGRFCSRTCAQRAARARKAAQRQTEAEKQTGSTAEHGLVKAVRRRLQKAGALETVNGQFALELARRAVDQSSPLVAMSKECDARITAALAEAAPESNASESGGGGASGQPETDEVRKAREARDRKRAALGETPAGRA